MGRRNRFFAVIVAAVFAANFTLAALNQVLWLFQPNASGSLWLEDPNAWAHLAIVAVLAIVFWVVANWAWGRVEGEMVSG